MTHPVTTCKACHRVVYVTDVDAKGLCCFCPEPKAEKADPKK